jgi:hypothetical protein
VAYLLYVIVAGRFCLIDLPDQFGARAALAAGLPLKDYLQHLLERLVMFGVPVASMAGAWRLLKESLPPASAAVDRANDVGLVKLAEKVEGLAGTELRDWNPGEEGMIYLAAAHPASEPGQPPQTAVVRFRRPALQSLWVNWDPADVLLGGPVLNWDGQVSGVLNRRSRFGGVLATKATAARQGWDRLVRGEVWGRWLVGAGPELGVTLAAAADGCRVTAVPPDWPTAPANIKVDDLIEKIDGARVTDPVDVDEALAGKDPGDEVALDMKRGSRTGQLKSRLLPRKA